MKLKAVSSDATSDLQSICKEVYSINFGNHWKEGGLEIYLHEQFGDARMANDLADPDVLYFFIEEEGENIGFAKAKLNVELEGYASSGMAELEKIYILPQHKGKGIGRTAMTQIMDICKSRSMEHLFLCVIDTNFAAQAFYEKLGFYFHSKIRLDAPNFKEELRGLNRMLKVL
ncbi:MAG: GNAT family N-acetyltransferase [Bacteroidia bacterium]|nr:GNAT family N-acetyltransferase [Bacteroidia bacterium]